VQKAEKYGFEFALSMIKLRGLGGKSEFWDYNLESFTLMAGLAAVTSKIKLFATTAVLTLPPAMVVRMASTIDSISGQALRHQHRFGLGESRIRPDGPVAGRRLFQPPLRIRDRIREGHAGTVDQRFV
jgi:alkanesulfonate monooxygenase SsuD/methylene tetrahydromethanopterin reductase-like flavin-dependent oxidoreductase (luciferase family)